MRICHRVQRGVKSWSVIALGDDPQNKQGSSNTTLYKLADNTEQGAISFATLLSFIIP